MTVFLIVGVVVELLAGLQVWALCRSAALGDRVRVTHDLDRWPS